MVKKRKNIYNIQVALSLIIFILGIGLFFGFTKNQNKVANINNKPTIVIMKNLAFVPSVKTIKANTTITWINKDVAIHNVHSGTPQHPTSTIVSKNLSKGQKFSYKFTKKGTYKYYCTIHSSIMQARIIVN